MKFEMYAYLLIALALLITMVFVLRNHAKDDTEPIRTIPVKLVKKREQHFVGRTYYSIFSLLFLTDTDEILEFNLKNKFDWDMLNEGDLGNLTYQGTRYIKFERTHINPPT